MFESERNKALKSPRLPGGTPQRASSVAITRPKSISTMESMRDESDTESHFFWDSLFDPSEILEVEFVPDSEYIESNTNVCFDEDARAVETSPRPAYPILTPPVHKRNSQPLSPRQNEKNDAESKLDKSAEDLFLALLAKAELEEREEKRNFTQSCDASITQLSSTDQEETKSSKPKSDKKKKKKKRKQKKLTKSLDSGKRSNKDVPDQN